MLFARRVFWFAAMYGFLVVTPLYFMETRLGQDFPPAITHPEFFYGFAGFALAWQVTFVLIGREPVRLRPIMLMAMLEKFSFAVAGIALYVSGRVIALTLFSALVDVLFVLLFYAAYRRTPRE